MKLIRFQNIRNTYQSFSIFFSKNQTDDRLSYYILICHQQIQIFVTDDNIEWKKYRNAYNFVVFFKTFVPKKLLVKWIYLINVSPSSDEKKTKQWNASVRQTSDLYLFIKIEHGIWTWFRKGCRLRWPTDGRAAVARTSKFRDQHKRRRDYHSCKPNCFVMSVKGQFQKLTINMLLVSSISVYTRWNFGSC